MSCCGATTGYDLELTRRRGRWGYKPAWCVGGGLMTPADLWTPVCLLPTPSSASATQPLAVAGTSRPGIALRGGREPPPHRMQTRTVLVVPPATDTDRLNRHGRCSETKHGPPKIHVFCFQMLMNHPWKTFQSLTCSAEGEM
jgi:hypothetical protein